MITFIFVNLFLFLIPSTTKEEVNLTLGNSGSSATPLGEILCLNIQLGLERTRVEGWKCLHTKATQHLSSIFEQEKATLAVVAKLETQLTEAEATEAMGRKNGASDAQASPSIKGTAP